MIAQAGKIHWVYCKQYSFSRHERGPTPAGVVLAHLGFPFNILYSLSWAVPGTTSGPLLLLPAWDMNHCLFRQLYLLDNSSLHWGTVYAPGIFHPSNLRAFPCAYNLFPLNHFKGFLPSSGTIFNGTMFFFKDQTSCSHFLASEDFFLSLLIILFLLLQNEADGPDGQSDPITRLWTS